MYNLKVRNIL